MDTPAPKIRDKSWFELPSMLLSKRNKFKKCVFSICLHGSSAHEVSLHLKTKVCEAEPERSFQNMCHHDQTDTSMPTSFHAVTFRFTKICPETLKHSQKTRSDILPATRTRILMLVPSRVWNAKITNTDQYRSSCCCRHTHTWISWD